MIGFLPFFHGFALGCHLTGAVRHGQTVVIMRKFDLEEYLKAIQRHKVIGFFNISRHGMWLTVFLFELMEVLLEISQLWSRAYGGFRKRKLTKQVTKCQKTKKTYNRNWRVYIFSTVCDVYWYWFECHVFITGVMEKYIEVIRSVVA